MKYGSQLNLPEESPMEHSSSQGYSQSQRSEETVEIKPLSPITELKYHSNGQNRIRNTKTVLFTDIENEKKKKNPNKSSPQFISSTFLQYFVKFEKDEKRISEEMKAEERIENDYIENISNNRIFIKTTMKVEQSNNNRTNMIGVEDGQSCHRGMIEEVRISSEIADGNSEVHLRSSAQDKRKLKIRSSTGELYRSRSRNPDKIAMSQDDELLDVYSSSFASDFMC